MHCNQTGCLQEIESILLSQKVKHNSIFKKNRKYITNNETSHSEAMHLFLTTLIRKRYI
ncbi:MAG: hypothetical protein ACM31E_08410 [Fibrobacterota bacterium]